ncbi:MAG: flagellar hook protein FlgE [Myxococcota bacterium]
MSITRTLNTGASGIRSHGEALGVTGDNIANVNTVGFKRSRAVFQDVLGRSIAGASLNPPTAGAGSKLAAIQQMWSQGALMTTDAPTDMAIAGDGFFMVQDPARGPMYTRAGQFNLDQEGSLINTQGLRLQGYVVGADGTMGTELQDLNVAGQTVPANATTQVDLSVQLNANDPIIAVPFDPADASNTSNHSGSVTVYDSLGNSHEITVYYRKTASNTWDWHGVIDGGRLNGGTANTPTEVASGTLNFTSNGALDSEAPNASNWNFVDATAPQAIAFDFGTSIADGGTGLDATTQFGEQSTNNGIAQDGYAAGTVAGITVGSDGTVLGTFTNGQRRDLGQVALATFSNVDGLERAGQGLWTATNVSGQALVGAPESGARGGIVAGALEGSNVDLGSEFVDMIAYQRGFQANSRVITTADEVYSELVNLKR